MAKRKEPDHFDWFGALEQSAKEAAALRWQTPVHVIVTCPCGATETQGRDVGQVFDLTADEADVTVERNEGGRPCRACPHYIHHGAMRVTRHFGNTTTVRDHFHPECVRLA